MRRIPMLTSPIVAAILFGVAFLGAGARAEAHLTVCNSSPNDLAIAEAFSTPNGHWNTNSAVLVAKTKCVTFGDQAAADETRYYLRVLVLHPSGSNTFTTGEETYAAPARSFCLVTGQFSEKAAGFTIKDADSQSECDYDKAHVHESGSSIEWVRFFEHTLPRPTTRLDLQ